MYTQKWYSLNSEYALDYYELLYRYYASCAPSIPVTYYSLDLPNSVYDDTLLNAGSYEVIGNLSGLLWKKINLLQVYTFEQMQFVLQSDEGGPQFKDRMSSIWIPSIYELEPKPRDFICFDIVKTREDQFQAELPLYQVVNIEKASSNRITFWKANLKSTFQTKENIELQLSGQYSFIDFEKHIYTLSDSVMLQKLMVRNSSLKINDFFKERIGLYVEADQ